MRKADQLEACGKTIGDPYADERLRLEAVAGFTKPVQGLAEDLPDLPEIVRIFGKTLKERILNVLTDSSECPQLRTHILHCDINHVFKNFASCDKNIKQASSGVRSSFNLGWPDIGSLAAKEIDFPQILDAMIRIVENPAEPDYLRNSAVIVFNRVKKFATQTCGLRIDCEDFDARFLKTILNPSARAQKYDLR